MPDLKNLPKEHGSFIGLVTSVYPDPSEAGVTIRTVDRPGSAHATLVYISALLDPTDLERLVLAPAARGIPDLPPEQLLNQGYFPAPEIRMATDADTLLHGLLSGLTAVHIEGHGAVLLVGTGRAEPPQDLFGPGLGANTAILYRHIRHQSLRTEALTGRDGTRCVLAYLQGKADEQLIQEVRTWTLSQGKPESYAGWWQKAANWLRLPPAVDVDSPAQVAVALRHGYVAVLDDHLPGVRLAPTTLEMLLTGPSDQALSPPIHRLVFWPRLLAAMSGLLISAGFVAVTSYHHAMLRPLLGGRGLHPGRPTASHRDGDPSG